MRVALSTLSLTNAALLVRGISSKLGFFANIFNTYSISGTSLEGNYKELDRGAVQSLVLRVNEPKRADVCTL
jgi:hypothetical protein